MKPRLLIIDDELPARNRLKTLLADIAAECPHELVGEAEDVRQGLVAIETLRPDVILLDVQMPGSDGMELAARLAGMADQPAVVFVTAFDDYALRAFEVQAADYLLKPVRASRLAAAIARATALRGAAPSQQTDRVAVREHFSVAERGRVFLVPVRDVIYCKAELKYVTLRTREREFVVEESLSAIEEEFAARFVRIHRNALVARDAILGFERGMQQPEGEEGEKPLDTWQVILRDVDERLPVSRRQWSTVKQLVRQSDGGIVPRQP